MEAKLFSRGMVFGKKKNLTVLLIWGNKQIRSSYDCNFPEYDYRYEGTNVVETLKEKTFGRVNLLKDFHLMIAKKFCQKLVSARKKQTDGSYIDDTDTIFNGDWSSFSIGAPDFTENVNLQTKFS